MMFLRRARRYFITIFFRTILSHFKNRKFVSSPIMACHVLPALSLHAHFSVVSVFLWQQRTLTYIKKKGRKENTSLAAFSESLSWSCPIQVDTSTSSQGACLPFCANDANQWVQHLSGPLQTSPAPPAQPLPQQQCWHDFPHSSCPKGEAICLWHRLGDFPVAALPSLGWVPRPGSLPGSTFGDLLLPSGLHSLLPRDQGLSYHPTVLDIPMTGWDAGQEK